MITFWHDTRVVRFECQRVHRWDPNKGCEYFRDQKPEPTDNNNNNNICFPSGLYVWKRIRLNSALSYSVQYKLKNISLSGYVENEPITETKTQCETADGSVDLIHIRYSYSNLTSVLIYYCHDKIQIWIDWRNMFFNYFAD